ERGSVMTKIRLLRISMRTSLRRVQLAFTLHFFSIFASTSQRHFVRWVAILASCTLLSLAASFHADAKEPARSSLRIEEALASNDDARQRALDALEDRGARTDLPNEPGLDHAPMQARDRAIPRKIDTSKLPQFGCN